MYSRMVSVAVNLAELDQEVSTAIGAAWSSNTLATRNSQWSKYFSFCTDINEIPSPASIRTVSRFLVFLGRTCKYSTVNNYLSAVVSLHKFYGYSSDFRESFMIKLVLKGLKTMLGDHTTQMKLLTTDQFTAMYHKAVLSDMDLTVWSVLMLSFRSLLRKSNMVPDVEKELAHVILRRDLEFHSWGMMIHVHSTKTLQCKEYVLEIPVYYVDNPIFCAASLVKQHLEKYPGPADGPVFLKQGNRNSQPVLYRDVQQFIKKAVTQIGLDPVYYGSHSMRRSGSAFLHSQGVPLEDIMVMGDWKSLAVLDYLVTPLSRKMDIQQKVATSSVFM